MTRPQNAAQEIKASTRAWKKREAGRANEPAYDGRPTPRKRRRRKKEKKGGPKLSSHANLPTWAQKGESSGPPHRHTSTQSAASEERSTNAREKAENPPHRRPTPTPRHTPPTPTPSARPIATREGGCGRGARGTGVGGGGCAGAGGRLEVVSREGDSLDNKGGKVREEGGRAGQRATLDGTHARSQPLSATIPRRPSESLHAHARDALDARAAEPAPKHDLHLRHPTRRLYEQRPHSNTTTTSSPPRPSASGGCIAIARTVDASHLTPRPRLSDTPTDIRLRLFEQLQRPRAHRPCSSERERPMHRRRARNASSLSLRGKHQRITQSPRVPTPQPALPSPPQENEEARDSPPGTLFKTSSTTNSSTSAGTERALATRPGKPASSEYVRIVWCLGYSEVSKEDKISCGTSGTMEEGEGEIRGKAKDNGI
ncbi:hypothetical protein C8F04DRAFT_1301926 [Mycena alexandri]|uniref:Uncharacterized protein n=1 Tax=Mycena alexandri TaxID=1745969 RepID=A0AAD6SBC1_9AGAR|nr:hypothetical protein C8F04DRAFT_1301926 [Mycena alexandri]